MDALGLELVRRLGVSPFLGGPRSPASTSVAGLAEATGASVETVRRRIAALTAEGVLAGRSLWPNFRLLGLRATTLHYRSGAPPAEAALARVVEVEGVVSAMEMLGGDVCVDLCARDDADLARRSRLVGALLGEVRPVAFLDYALPEPTKPLTPLDWRVIRALRADADRDPQEVADEIGVSRRTVVRRLDALWKARAIDVVANFDPGALRGHLLCYLLLRLREGAARADAHEVARAFPSGWVAQWSPPDRSLADLVLVTVASSTRDVDALRREALTLPSVGAAEVLVLLGARASPGWLDEAIDREVVAPKRAVSRMPRRVR